MPPKVLILTEPQDAHAHAVAEALRIKGAEPILWFTSDFPLLAGESVLFQGEGSELIVRGPGIAGIPPDIQTVWHRRPAYVLDESALHPADRQFADLQCRVFRRSLFSLLLPSAFWVNPPDAARTASRKPFQHASALAEGLAMPDTLYSNDPEAIRQFLRNHEGRVVYKPLKGTVWRDESTYWMPYTSLLTEADLVGDVILRSTPGIYQALVPKSYELRITVMGRRVFGAKVLSQDTTSGRLDWRKSYAELKMSPAEVPSEIADHCVGLLSRLGLAFGCFDFIVTPEGRHIFLEVNEMGQFLFIEEYTGLPLLDAFCEFLLHGSSEFKWDEKRSLGIRYSDVAESVRAAMSESAQAHQGLGDTAVWEGVPPSMPT